MSEKPKNRPVRANSAPGIECNSVSGHLIDSCSPLPSQSAIGVNGEATHQTNQPKLQPRPSCEDVDIDQFVSDLLVSDKDIMDYLAR